MSQPLIPLNFPTTQAEAQVAQFKEGVTPSFYTRTTRSALGTVASAETGAPGSTVSYVGQ